MDTNMLVKKITSLGLSNITTATQLKNEIFNFQCPKTGNVYSVYIKTGYNRITYKSNSCGHLSQQLNPTKIQSVNHGYGPVTRKCHMTFPNEPEILFDILYKEITK